MYFPTIFLITQGFLKDPLIFLITLKQKDLISYFVLWSLIITLTTHIALILFVKSKIFYCGTLCLSRQCHELLENSFCSSQLCINCPFYFDGGDLTQCSIWPRKQRVQFQSFFKELLCLVLAGEESADKMILNQTQSQPVWSLAYVPNHGYTFGLKTNFSFNLLVPNFFNNLSSSPYHHHFTTAEMPF